VDQQDRSESRIFMSVEFPAGQIPSITAVILAGGRSSRMGRDKSFIRLTSDGPCLIEMVIKSALPVASAVMISTNNPESYRWLPYPLIADSPQYREAGPLAGLEAGLSAAQASTVIALGCDMPFIVTDVLRCLLDQIQDGSDAIVPLNATGQPEPLCAVYLKSCLPAIRDHLDRGLYKLSGWLDSVHTRYVSAAELRAYDPLLRSFENLNTPQDVADRQPDRVTE
jgi:molybdopterin-guanine dinucleotide biosynthesis protein A